MPIPDISDLTAAELRELIEASSAAFYAAEAAQKAADEARREAIGNAVASLETLLGPEGAAPGVNSIRAVRAHDAADIAAGEPRGTTMAANATTALSLLYEGLEMLTTTTRDVAKVIARNQGG